MRIVAYDEELVGRIRAALADRTDVEEKKMFGGLSFMVAGQMCCGVLKNDLVVRIEPAEFDKLIAQPHVRAFDFTGRPMQGWCTSTTAPWPIPRSCGRGCTVVWTTLRRTRLRPSVGKPRVSPGATATPSGWPPVPAK